jgi:AcrR family transcriptional regulator
MRKPGSNGTETLRNLRSAAIRLFSERGYEGMNLRLLAQSIGVRASSLYNYIDSKQQLLFWLMKEGIEKLLAEVDARLEGIEDPEEQMRAFVAFHLGYRIANRKEYAVLFMEGRSLNKANRSSISRLSRVYTEKLHNIIKHGIATGKFRIKDSQVATFALLQMLGAVLRWYRPSGRLTLDELIEVYTDLALGMLHVDRRTSAVQPLKDSAVGKWADKDSSKSHPQPALSAETMNHNLSKLA